VVALVPVALVFATRGTDSPPVAAIEASVPDVAVAPPSATVVAPPPCPEETYLARLADGRKALGKKKLDDAREALNLALDCRADDAAALSERGYSWYLSGEMGNANEDLALASRKTTVRALLATIWFRRGLVDENAFGEDGAKRAFATSVAFGGGEAARKKLDGDDVCDVSIERYRTGELRYGDHQAHTADHVAELFSELEGFDDTVTSDDEAWTKSGNATKSFPALLELPGTAATGHWLVTKGNTSLWAFELGVLYKTYQWTGDAHFELSPPVAGLVHAHGHHAKWLERTVQVGDIQQTGSGDGPVTAVDAYFDPKREVALVVRRGIPGRFAERADVPAPKVWATAKGVFVRQMGCSLTEPWEEAPPDAGVQDDVLDAAQRDASGDAPEASAP
jgi:hypothetical protein